MHAFVVLCLVFQSQAKRLAWKTSLKWPILCRVGHKTLTQSISVPFVLNVFIFSAKPQFFVSYLTLSCGHCRMMSKRMCWTSVCLIVNLCAWCWTNRSSLWQHSCPVLCRRQGCTEVQNGEVFQNAGLHKSRKCTFMQLATVIDFDDFIFHLNFCFKLDLNSDLF